MYYYAHVWQKQVKYKFVRTLSADQIKKQIVRHFARQNDTMIYEHPKYVNPLLYWTCDEYIIIIKRIWVLILSQRNACDVFHATFAVQYYLNSRGFSYFREFQLFLPSTLYSKNDRKKYLYVYLSNIRKAMHRWLWLFWYLTIKFDQYCNVTHAMYLHNIR